MKKSTRDPRLMSVFDGMELTPGQREAVGRLDDFLADPGARCFLLKGYAGTGKTFLLKGLADHLVRARRVFSLLAPTGRAARVIKKRTGYDAHTIHRSIYALNRLVEHAHADDAFRYNYELRDNAGEETDLVYIVDEGSMVSDRESEGEFLRFGSGRLLSDLARFARLDNPELNSKLIVAGDTAQLPPVADGDHSQAIDAGYLRVTFGLNPAEHELTDVVRQAEGSGIVRHATRIRDDLSARRFDRLSIEPIAPDVRQVSVEELPALCLEGGAARRDTICITYTNRAALAYNRMLREALYGEDGMPPPRPGDRLLVVCNSGRYGLFNGDLVEAAEVDARVEHREVRGVPLSFRNVVISRVEEDGRRVAQRCMILENLLGSGERDVTRAEQQALYIDFKMRHKGLKPNTETFRQALQDDPYFNALKVKYGYAVTCHKAQGGEWDRAVVVFEKRRGWDNPSWFRWCYTAITRARRELLTVNAPCWSAFSGLIGRVSDLGAGPAARGDTGRPSVELPAGDTDSPANPGAGSIVDAKPEDAGPDEDVAAFLRAKLGGYKALLSGQGIELVRSEHRPASWYVRLFLEQGVKTACLQAYYTKCWKFKAPQWIRRPGDSADLLKAAEEAFVKCRPAWPEAPQSRSAAGRQPDGPVFPEDRPYLAELHAFLLSRLESGIVIRAVEHMAYAERYTFMRGAEKRRLTSSIMARAGFGRRRSRRRWATLQSWRRKC